MQDCLKLIFLYLDYKTFVNCMNVCKINFDKHFWQEKYTREIIPNYVDTTLYCYHKINNIPASKDGSFVFKIKKLHKSAIIKLCFADNINKKLDDFLKDSYYKLHQILAFKNKWIQITFKHINDDKYHNLINIEHLNDTYDILNKLYMYYFYHDLEYIYHS